MDNKLQQPAQKRGDFNNYLFFNLKIPALAGMTAEMDFLRNRQNKYLKNIVNLLYYFFRLNFF